jgi:hypothetical protein
MDIKSSLTFNSEHVMISCHIIIVDYIFDKINKSLCHMFMD